MKHQALSRRRFLGAAALIAGGSAFPTFVRSAFTRQGTNSGLSSDDTIILERLTRGASEDLSQLPMGELVAAMGRSFLDSPYMAKTLEEPGEEHLVVNVREFDCVSFVECSLTLARAIKLNGMTPEDYRNQLRLLRYRGGEIDGYPSRLHYFTEWVADNEKKKAVRNISRELGGIREVRKVNFMSTHRPSYAQLARDDVNEKIIQTEHRLNRMQRYFIPKKKVAARLAMIQSGDIIGVTTSIAGLDCSHTGMAAADNNVMKFLHAPQTGGRVRFSRGSLAEYLGEHTIYTGIIVARPVDPAVT